MDNPLVDSLISPSIYNSLPIISDNADIPSKYAQDLTDLRTLLRKHQIPSSVSIRLIHKHFDAQNGEIMVFQDVQLPKYGHFKVMSPIIVTEQNDSCFRGSNYFVNQDGRLHAYEYVDHEVYDLSVHRSFLIELCYLVVERGLQHKFGLSLKAKAGLSESIYLAEGGKGEDEKAYWEFEVPSKRSTILFPSNAPMPTTDMSVITEWSYGPQPTPLKCYHPKCAHGNCVHDAEKKDEFSLSGHPLVEGSELHGIVTDVLAIVQGRSRMMEQ